MHLRAFYANLNLLTAASRRRRSAMWNVARITHFLTRPPHVMYTSFVFHFSELSAVWIYIWGEIRRKFENGSHDDRPWELRPARPLGFP
jgi:hypothetical protein